LHASGPSMPSLARNSRLMMLRLAALLAASTLVPIHGLAAERSCMSAAGSGVKSARANFEHQQGVTIDGKSFDTIAQEIVKETCSQLSTGKSQTSRARVAGRDAMRRYLENILALGQSASVEALVAGALGREQGLGRMDRRSFGVLKVTCSSYPDATVSIDGSQIAQCGRRILVPSGENDVSVSSKGSAVCVGRISITMQQEKSCECAQSGATPTGVVKAEPMTCS